MQRFLITGVGGPSGGAFPLPSAGGRFPNVRIPGTLVVDPQLLNPTTGDGSEIIGRLVVDPQRSAPNLTFGIGVNLAIDPHQDDPSATVGIGVTLTIL